MTTTRFFFLFLASSLFFAGVFWLGSRPVHQTDAALLGPPEINAESQAIRDELLRLLESLKTLELDTSFLSDPRYLSLVDWSVTIGPQPTGRRNPFLPVGVDE